MNENVDKGLPSIYDLWSLVKSNLPGCWIVTPHQCKAIGVCSKQFERQNIQIYLQSSAVFEK